MSISYVEGTDSNRHGLYPVRSGISIGLRALRLGYRAVGELTLELQDVHLEVVRGKLGVALPTGVA